jgi:hypothetical protein
VAQAVCPLLEAAICRVETRFGRGATMTEPGVIRMSEFINLPPRILEQKNGSLKNQNSWSIGKRDYFCAL